MDYYRGVIPIIDYHTAEGRDLAHPKHAAYGAVPRDYSVQPAEMFAQPDQMEIIPESEHDARWEEQERTKSSLEHAFLGSNLDKPAFVNLDQNGQGFCWAYSTAHAIMLTRLKMGLPLVRLSAHAVACKIKNFRDEGGWGGLSAKFGGDQGYPSTEFWAEKSMSRSYDNAKTWENAALHKITDEWVDLTRDVYEQNLTIQQLATSGFNNQAGPVDFNFWSHSVCFVRWVRIAAGDWGTLILNSWLNWGRFGLGVLRGAQRVPDGALTLRSVTISQAA